MSRKKILAIDDEPVALGVLEEVLEETGYLVLTAPNGAEGLSRAHDEHPDLILLDLVMEGMDGWETLRRLKLDDRCRDIPVVILSARGQPTDKIRALQDGAVDYLTKPVSMRDSIDRIQRILRPDPAAENGP